VLQRIASRGLHPRPVAAYSKCLRAQKLATIDHIILKVNDLGASVKFYTEVLGFVSEGMDGPSFVN